MQAVALSWWTLHQARLIFGLRMAVAALVSYVLAEFLALTQVYWVVLSSIIVIQGSAGGSLKAAIDRLVGTVGGAVWGAVIAIVIHHDKPGSMMLALALALIPLTILTGYRPVYRVAPITAIIVLMGSGPHIADPLLSAFHRTVEIGLGSGVAVAVVLIVVPSRASRMLARTAAGVAQSMADLVKTLNTGFDHTADTSALLKIQDDIGVGIARAEVIANEAQLELTTHIANGPSPEPVVRTLRRLRHDLAILGRASRTPLPQEVRVQLSEPLMEVFRAVEQQLRTCAEALSDKKKAPTLEHLRATITAYNATFARLREGGLAQNLAPEVVERVFALSFLFDQIKKNLMDLADRTDELADPEMEQV